MLDGYCVSLKLNMWTKGPSASILLHEGHTLQLLLLLSVKPPSSIASYLDFIPRLLTTPASSQQWGKHAFFGKKFFFHCCENSWSAVKPSSQQWGKHAFLEKKMLFPLLWKQLERCKAWVWVWVFHTAQVRSYSCSTVRLDHSPLARLVPQLQLRAVPRGACLWGGAGGGGCVCCSWSWAGRRLRLRRHQGRSPGVGGCWPAVCVCMCVCVCCVCVCVCARAFG